MFQGNLGNIDVHFDQTTETTTEEERAEPEVKVSPRGSLADRMQRDNPTGEVSENDELLGRALPSLRAFLKGAFAKALGSKDVEVQFDKVEGEEAVRQQQQQQQQHQIGSVSGTGQDGVYFSGHIYAYVDDQGNFVYDYVEK